MLIERAARTRVRRFFRRTIFGDWHPLLRDPLDLVRLSFAAAALVFLVAGSFEYAIRFAFTFFVLVFAQRLLLPRRFDLLFIFAMALQAWGNALRLFENVGWWDDVVHLVLPLASVPVLYVLLLRLGMVSDLASEQHRRHRVAFVIFAIGMGLSMGAVYEIYEYVMHHKLNADIAIGYDDTIDDLTLDTVGSLIGGMLLMLSSALGWETRRVSGPRWHERAATSADFRPASAGTRAPRPARYSGRDFA